MKILLIIASLLVAPLLHAAPGLTLCSYDCSQPLQHQLSASSWQRITELFAAGSATAVQQRRQLAHALTLMERDLLTRLAETRGEHGQPDDNHDAGSESPGDMFSNLDETRNTTRFIGLLQDHGLLGQHVLRRSEQRSNLVGMKQSTAVIQSLQTGEPFAVDATSSGFGEAPLIMPLQAWKNGTVVKKLLGGISRFMSSDEDRADTDNNSESSHGRE